MRFWSCATCAPFFDEGSKQTTTIAADPPAQPMRPPALDQPDVAVVAFAEGPRARPSPWSMKGSQLCQKGAISFRTGCFSCRRDVSEEVVLQSRPRRRRSRRTRSTLRSAPPSTAIEQGGPESGCFSCQRDVSEGHKSSSLSSCSSGLSTSPERQSGRLLSFGSRGITLLAVPAWRKPPGRGW